MNMEETWKLYAGSDWENSIVSFGLGFLLEILEEIYVVIRNSKQLGGTQSLIHLIGERWAKRGILGGWTRSKI